MATLLKNIILQVSVHTESINSYGSNDFTGYKIFDNENEMDKFIKENHFNIRKVLKDNLISKKQELVEEMRIDDELSLMYVVLNTFEYNYRRKECELLFSKERPLIINDYYKNLSDRENSERKLNGFIIFKETNEMNSTDYFGALNTTLTNLVKEYLEEGRPGGYLGHYTRKYAHDKIIEDVLEQFAISCSIEEDLNKYEIMGAWLHSKIARYYMDSNGDKTDDDFRKAMEKDMETILIDGFCNYYEYETSTCKKVLKVSKII